MYYIINITLMTSKFQRIRNKYILLNEIFKIIDFRKSEINLAGHKKY